MRLWVLAISCVVITESVLVVGTHAIPRSGQRGKRPANTGISVTHYQLCTSEE